MANPRLTRSLLPTLALALALCACGGAAKSANYTAPTSEQVRVFDHGADFVAALEGLEGRWRDDWDRDLQERVGGSDVIALIHVETLLTETDPEQVVTHRLVARVTRTVAGRTEKSIELRVREGQPGFASIHDNVARIQARDFLLFAKWFSDDHGARAAHFHLSPASEAIVSETEKIVALRKGSENKSQEGRTIVYTNKE